MSERLFQAVRRVIVDGIDSTGTIQELHEAFYAARDERDAVVRGQRGTGRDGSVEVDSIAWPDGTYTIAEVRIDASDPAAPIPWRWLVWFSPPTPDPANIAPPSYLVTGSNDRAEAERMADQPGYEVRENPRWVKS